MLKNKKTNNKIRVIALLSLILISFAEQSFSQTKWNFQVSSGYAISQGWTQGYNIDFSINRKIWNVISVGFYYDVTEVNNFIPEISQSPGEPGSGYYSNANYFISPDLNKYILSLPASEAFMFEQSLYNFMSFGLKTNFDFKIAKNFKLGFYVGTGITKRIISDFFLSEISSLDNKIIDYVPGIQYVYATELSFRYGLKLTYDISKKINFLIQIGHNTSKFKKHPYSATTYDKANIGVSYKF